ncbi:MAG TPA: efflux RND transporter periplasmic adaptor subunit [Clostridia bacterium]|nr:efflux RND transporter periplasmic adaptor subunit [Clostridia bacterium]
MKKKLIWIIVILAAAGLTGLKIMLGSPELAVETSKVTVGSIAEYVEETCSLKLEEETSVYSVSAGKVIEVTKKAGETVKAGEVLARIDNSDILLQLKALEAQRAEISAGYAEAKKAEEDEAILILKANLKAAEALYAESKRLADNNRVLYESGAISLDAYKSSMAKLAADEASLETAGNNLALAEKGISDNVKKQYEAQLSGIQANIEQLKLKAEEMTVRSPADGLVMSEEVKEGNIVQAGTKLYDIGGSNGYYFESDVLIEDLEGVLVGSPAIIEDEDMGIKDVRGKVRKIHPRAESVTSDLGIEQKRVKIEIEPDNPVEGMRPGYDATVKIITQSKENTLLVPEKAVFDYQGRDHVFVNENGTAKLRTIEKGLESDEQVEVLSGLKEGELVVLSPAEELEEGARIKQK